MSEFTTGVLYLRKHETKVLQQLPKSKQPYFHKNVNGDWNAFFLQDEWLQSACTLQFILSLSSKYVPLLWFHDDGEIGWGFRLFDGGYEVTSATISYSLDVELAEEEMSRRYPYINLSKEILVNEKLRQEYEDVLEGVLRSDRFRQEVEKGLARFRCQWFSRFLSHKQVQQLRSLFDVVLLTDCDEETGSMLLYDSVDLFKEILGIEEMMWVNYSYLASGGRE
jgi:hypothetical protein